MTFIRTCVAAMGFALGLAGSSSGAHHPVRSIPSRVVRPESWRPISIAGAPVWRGGQVFVWTQKEMIVWGGHVDSASSSGVSNAGARYDPTSDAWRPISAVGAPSGKDSATAVWTGAEMIVWGGGGIVDGTYVPFNTGARYDPALDSWRAMAAPDFLEGRYWHSAVWTGARMIVWGGQGIRDRLLADGGAYDPLTDRWTPLSPAPLGGRRTHAAVWTGTEMIVWSGVVGYGTDSLGVTSTGLRYDPLHDSWSQTSRAERPVGAIVPKAVWTGSRVIVISPPACLSVQVDGGSGLVASYDPASDVWEALPPLASEECAPCDVLAAWTEEALVALGEWNAQYRPDQNAWLPLARKRQPVLSCLGQTAVWTGSQMIVWGPGPEYSGSWTPER